MIYLWLTLVSEPLKIEVTNLSQPPHTPVGSHILDALATLLWVLFAAYLVHVFKEPVTHLLKNLPGSVTKLGIAGVEIEFAKKPPLELDSSATQFGQMTKDDAAQVSYIQPLIQEIKKDPVPDSYITIDLGNGHKWLTSRLFIFAVMFRRMRAVRCFVFMDNSQGVLNKYLGSASTESIRWALAMRYPWLERAYVKAYHDAIQALGPDTSFIASALGKLQLETNPDWAGTVITNYVQELRPATKPGEPERDPREWTTVNLQTTPVEEHAAWIDSSRLFHDLKGQLWTDTLTHSWDRKMKVKAIPNMQDPFIALTKQSGQFLSLIERTRVLVDLAKRFSAQLD